MKKHTAKYEIRPIDRADLPSVVTMMRSIRIEQGDSQTKIDEQSLCRAIFASRPSFFLFIANYKDIIVGFIAFRRYRDPIFGVSGLQLADLYVAPRSRRLGIAQALMQTLGRQASRRRAKFIWWIARATNKDAIAFYRRIGAIEAPTMSFGWPANKWSNLVSETQRK